jgi:hypothetical protein
MILKNYRNIGYEVCTKYEDYLRSYEVSRRVVW